MDGGAERTGWATWGGGALLLLLLVILPQGVRRLIAATHRLVSYEDLGSAIDLRIRVLETTRWWNGENIYASEAHAVYPPSAYLVLRGLIVSGEFEVARVVWAVEFFGLLLVASWLMLRFSGTRALPGKVFVAAIPWLLEATPEGIVNGQYTIVPVLAAIGAVALASRDRARWSTDLAAAALFVLATAKPTIGAPFFWLLLFLPGRFRPGMLGAAAVGITTWLACVPQDESLRELLSRWLARALAGARDGAVHGGSGNAQTLLGTQGFAMAGPVTALALLGGLGAWSSGRARALLWPMLGVAGVVARLAVYHRTYDDLLLLPMLIALLRLSSGLDGAAQAPRLRGAALAVLGCCLWVMSVDWLWFLPTTVDVRLGGALPVLWLCGAVVLVFAVEREHRSREGGEPVRQDVPMTPEDR